MNPTTRIVLSAALLLPLFATAEGKWTKKAEAGKPLYAVLKTNHGDITVRLYSKEAPKTVANFVGLATGEKEWTDPSTHAKTSKALYDGVTCHRVIPDFMVQCGDPTGQGNGDIGYTFEDEFQSGKTFDKVGLLAMANRGPRTNSSQFFITTSKPQHLNNRHTIFGEVTAGYDNVVKISNVPRGPMDRPNTPVVIKKIELSEAPPGLAKAGDKAADRSAAAVDKGAEKAEKATEKATKKAEKAEEKTEKAAE